MRDLAGKVVLLTGASRGIGVALAVGLARRGARLVLTARDAAGLEATAAKVREAGGEAVIFAGDVAKEADRAALVAAADALGPLEGVVHNAGVETTMAFVDQSAQDVARQIAVNLEAPLQLTRLVLPGLVARRSGFVVFVSSMSGKSPTPYNAVYTATKHGLVGFSASLRIELRDTGVHAGVVCPGFVDEAGMFHDLGVPAPAAMRAVPLQAVVAATLRAVDGGVEELVTPAPMRPLLALNQLFPRLAGPVLSGLGILAVLEERAKVEAARRGGG